MKMKQREGNDSAGLVEDIQKSMITTLVVIMLFNYVFLIQYVDPYVESMF